MTGTDDKNHHSLVLFRKGLRLHDNEPLRHAIATSQVVYPVYVIDLEWQRKQEKLGSNKMRFLLECLTDLDNNLKKMGSRLFVLQGDALTVIKKFCKDNEITQMTRMKDAEVFYKRRDNEIDTVVNRLEIVTKTFGGHTLYEPQAVIDANDGEIPLDHKEFTDLAAKLGNPVMEVPDISPESFKQCLCQISETHDQQYGVPTLEALGIPPATALSSWVGGETPALARLADKMKDDNLMTISVEKEDYMMNPSTTGLSPYLNFGCLSPRRFWHSVTKLSLQKMVPLHGQLLFREFFYTAASSVNNFTKMEGNKICRQIKWYSNPDHLAAWREGRTGYPWIDAICRQMVIEGHTHHIARYAQASFLCLGDLWLNWTDGQEAFEEYLLDGDYAMNAGCWMWCTGSAFSENIPERCLDPVKFGRKWDPNGNFIRMYCPELRLMPLKYLFSPWKAPRHIQEEAKCLIGEDYPKPIVDHKNAASHNLELIKELNRLEINDDSS